MASITTSIATRFILSLNSTMIPFLTGFLLGLFALADNHGGDQTGYAVVDVDNRVAGEVERSAAAGKLLSEAKEPGRNKIVFSI
jgi:hypothetical protein